METPATRGVELIPRDILFGNRARDAVRISPDGTTIAFVGPVDGVRNLWIAPYDNPAAARPVTNFDGHGVTSFFVWAYSNKHLVFFKDEAGDENYRAHSIDLVTGTIIPLTPGPGVRSYFMRRSLRMPYQVLLAHNARDRRRFDLFRFNIATGAPSIVERNDDFVWFVADGAYAPRIAARVEPDGGRAYLVKTGTEWQPFLTLDPEDETQTYPAGLSGDGKSAYWFDSRGRNGRAVVEMDLASKAVKVLAADPRADCVGYLAHPTNNQPQAAVSFHLRKRWHIIDPALSDHFAALEHAVPGEIEEVIRSSLDGRWVVKYRRDNAPPLFYGYNTATRVAAPLFPAHPDAESRPLVTMRPLTVTSRDGLDLVCYLSLPKGASDSLRPPEPLPMVLYVHGGPWFRDIWGYRPDHQWLANRGYAVLSVNYRGSTGLGKAFVNASDREWAGKMHEDLIDAVDWAIREGIADPARVAIMGGSYGGYSTLVGLTFSPEKFACGVDYVGISNLVTFLNTVPPYWRPWLPSWKKRIGGDPDTEDGRAFLRARSPLTYVDRIVRPLLIAHGSNDPRVKQSESDQIVAAMQARRLPVTYLVFPDEGHGFVRRDNRLAFFATAEAFLAKHLGGRLEPIGDAVARSSAQIRAGGDLIPGLSGARAA